MIELTLSQIARAVGGEVLLASGDTPETLVAGAVDTDSRCSTVSAGPSIGSPSSSGSGSHWPT